MSMSIKQIEDLESACSKYAGIEITGFPADKFPLEIRGYIYLFAKESFRKGFTEGLKYADQNPTAKKS
jgi:hypothetical protein